MDAASFFTVRISETRIRDIIAHPPENICGNAGLCYTRTLALKFHFALNPFVPSLIEAALRQAGSPFSGESMIWLLRIYMTAAIGLAMYGLHAICMTVLYWRKREETA